MIIKWEEQQKPLLAKMPIPFDVYGDLTDEQLKELYEIIPDYMLKHANIHDEDDVDFNLCEDILTLASKAMEKRKLLAYQQEE